MAWPGGIRCSWAWHAAMWAVFAAGIAAGCRRDRDGQLLPTLASIQANVFDVHCAVANCHRGPAPESQMSLEAGRAYDNLVDVRSVGLGDLYRVRPGRSDSSYLVRKLMGEGIVGERMPLAAKPLPDSVVTVIREWIDSGARPE